MILEIVFQLSNMEKAKTIDTGFSTADAEWPRISEDNDGNLELSFIDWREQGITVVFEDYAAYKWQSIETFVEGEEYDRCHVIENSKWLKEHLDQEVITLEEGHKHYKLNFNACGQFEVIAKKILFNGIISRLHGSHSLALQAP